MHELETVATFETLGAAEAARGMLESAGIRALVNAHRVWGVDLFRNKPQEPICLQVRSDEAERARELLRGVADAPHSG